MKKTIRLFCISVLMLAMSTVYAETDVQTPWQNSSGGWLMKNLNWPGYNTGYDFIANSDGHIVKLGGLFRGTKEVRLYDAAGNVLARTRVAGNNNWAYSDITPVAVTAGEKYTVAVNTGWGGGASMHYGRGFPDFPLSAGDITMLRPVFGFGSKKPTNSLYNQMWGQADVGFVSIDDPINNNSDIAVEGIFPESPLYINLMPSTDPIEPTVVEATLVMSNNGDFPVSYVFNTSQLVEIEIKDMNGQVVTYSSRGKFYLQMLQFRTIYPGQSWRFTDSVELTTADGNPLAEGDYTMSVRLVAERMDDQTVEPPMAQTDITILYAW